MTNYEEGGQRWWEPFYDEYLERVLLDSTSVEEIDETLAFIEAKLELAPGAAVFDQCCGSGRLSIPLARRGYEVIGVDQARRYIESARDKAATEELAAEFVTADAFEYRPEKPVQGAINWWTSFGYGTDVENQKMLQRAYESLVPGGIFLLDTFNLIGVLRNFKRHVVNRCDTEEGEITLIRESKVDTESGLLLKTWTYILPDARRVIHDSRVRLYLPHRIAEMLESCGFEGVGIYGGVDGEPIELDSERCILRARRSL